MSKQSLSAYHQLDELVINWHITEACNFRCQYCYSTWSHPKQAHELCRSRVRTSKLLTSLREYFDSDNTLNPLTSVLGWRSVRLNIAGGEATLYKSRLPEVVQEAKEIGFKISLITNGYLFAHEVMQMVIPHLSMVGISIDSADPATNLAIGRVQRNGGLLDLAQLAECLVNVKAAHPTLKIKVNTVVNSANAHEDLTPWISKISPERWKVLRALPVVSDALSASDEQFMQFVQRHMSLSAVMSIEDNDDMTGSYLMLDPYGRFFQNLGGKTEEPYCFSDPVDVIGADKAFSQISFSATKFAKRYLTPSPQGREA